MNGRRINLRRGVGKSAPAVEEGGSVFAKVARADTEASGDDGWGSMLGDLLSRQAIAQVVTSGGLLDGILWGPTTGRMSRYPPETQELPRAQVHDSLVIGVDPAAPGQELTGITARQMLEGNGYTTTTRTRIVDQYAPSLEVNRRYEDMTTQISLRIYLRGPSSPPSYCVASFRDEEFNHLRGSYAEAHEIHEEIVRRLLDAVSREVRTLLVRALEEATRTDGGLRRELLRITGGLR